MQAPPLFEFATIADKILSNPKFAKLRSITFPDLPEWEPEIPNPGHGIGIGPPGWKLPPIDPDFGYGGKPILDLAKDMLSSLGGVYLHAAKENRTCDIPPPCDCCAFVKAGDSEIRIEGLSAFEMLGVGIRVSSKKVGPVLNEDTCIDGTKVRKKCQNETLTLKVGVDLTITVNPMVAGTELGIVNGRRVRRRFSPAA